MTRLLTLVLLLLGVTSSAPAQPRFFQDESFHFEFVRVLGAAPYKGSDIGECLEAARHIQEGDFESWYRAWYALAERIRRIGDEAEAAGHLISAQEAWLRASGYYRSAEFYLHGRPQDPRILEAWGKSRQCFLRASARFRPPLEPVRIPYEGTTLPGYLYRVDLSSQARPTLLLQTGFDGTQEELFPQALAGVERGYNVLTFEGPGQGAPLREQHLTFRPDWEKVVSPVVDFAVHRPEVDPRRLALMGISLGGYLAPRAAAFEPRLAALIPNGGVYWPVEALLKPMYGVGGLPSKAADFLDFIRSHPDQYNSIARESQKGRTSWRWFLEHGMFAFGASSPADLMLAYARLNMAGLAERIPCPTLVIDSEQDFMMAGQARQLYESLRCPREWLLFTTAEGAQYHCQMGAFLVSNQKIFDWLDRLLRPGLTPKS